MSKNRETPQIAFPEGWTKQVRSAELHVICRIEKENGIMMRYVWCNLIVMLTATAAPAASYFVAVDGQAGNDGSHAKPWPSVEFALSKVGAGNTIIVRPGVYRGPWQIRNHPAEPGGPPTIIQSEVKWKAVVNGGEGEAINVVDCPGIVLDGFEVSGARGEGISMNTDLGTVRNCWVHNNDHMGVSSHGHRGVRIEANLIEFNGCNIQFHHGVYADGEGLTVCRNIVRHNSGYGLHLYPSIKDATVSQNLVFGHVSPVRDHRRLPGGRRPEPDRAQHGGGQPAAASRSGAVTGRGCSTTSSSPPARCWRVPAIPRT